MLMCLFLPKDHNKDTNFNDWEVCPNIEATVHLTVAGIPIKLRNILRFSLGIHASNDDCVEGV